MVADDLRREQPCERKREFDYEAAAQVRTFAFLETIPRIREMLARDVEAAYQGDPAAGSQDEIIFCYPGLEAVTIYRIAHELLKLDVPLKVDASVGPNWLDGEDV